MNTKFMYVILILIVLLFGFLIISQYPSGNSYLHFSKYVNNSEQVYIVMDLDSVLSAYPDANSSFVREIRKNIMQCGVDLAGYFGSFKKVIPLSIGDGKCYIGDSIFPVSYCNMLLSSSDSLDNSAYIIVEYGNTSTFVLNTAYIGIGEIYMLGECANFV